MTKYIGNKIGVAVTSFENGGIFNQFDNDYGRRTWFFAATGGTKISSPSGYTYHVFTSPGDFNVTGAGAPVEYLIVGGGGSGGAKNTVGGGGGGAGGFRTGETTVVIGLYPITVGAGGPNLSGQNGSPSTALNITSQGGGYGSGGGGVPGIPGGSGGGSGYREPATTPSLGGSGSSVVGTPFASPTPAPSQGNPGGGGGRIAGVSGTGGGGGGAGAPGVDAHPLSSFGTGGAGGNGLAAFSGSADIPPAYGTPGPTPGRWFAGGGGGGPDGRAPGTEGPAVGGAGGGGTTGVTYTPGSGVNAVVNTGGGGRADTFPGAIVVDGISNGSVGGAPGIVILRYQS